MQLEGHYTEQGITDDNFKNSYDTLFNENLLLNWDLVVTRLLEHDPVGSAELKRWMSDRRARKCQVNP